MEFKLNKIDTDLRQKINEERSTDKIHHKKGININKDKDKNSDKSEMKKDKVPSKTEQPEVSDEDIDKEEIKSKDPNRGNFIDIRR